MGKKHTKKNQNANYVDDLAFHLRRVLEDFCARTRWLDYKETVRELEIGRAKMFRVTDHMETLMEGVKKFQKLNGEHEHVSDETSRSQNQIFGLLHELEKFSAGVEKANAAADLLFSVLEDFNAEARDAGTSKSHKQRGERVERRDSGNWSATRCCPLPYPSPPHNPIRAKPVCKSGSAMFTPGEEPARSRRSAKIQTCKELPESEAGRRSLASRFPFSTGESGDRRLPQCVSTSNQC